MESTGTRLKKIRLEKGISLEEVHKKTKINLNVLRAIEEDSLINLSPVYTKGFLKIYCRFLGQNPDDFMPDYKEPKAASAKVSPPAARESQLPSFFKTASEKISSLKIRKIKPKPVIISVLAAVFLIGLFNLGKAVSSAMRNRSPAKEGQIKSATAKQEDKDKAAQLAESQAVKPASAPQQAETAVKAESLSVIRLGIIARENCYIPYLKTDGKTVFQGVLKKGRSEIWQAKTKIEFSLGNAGVVDIEVNGRQIPSLGRRGQAVKNIVIDKEGLKTN